MLLNIALILLLAGYLVHGYRAGLTWSLAGLAGLAAGAVASFLVAPLLGQSAGASLWRVPLIVAVTVVFLGLGHAVGSACGRVLRRGVHKTPLRLLDRALGAAVDVTVAALVLAMLSFGIGSLGIPALSAAVGSSPVLRTIDALTPESLQTGLARLKDLVTKDTAGRVLDSLASPAKTPDPTTTTASPTVPNVDTDTALLRQAARSVVKITGLAAACRQTQSGSGFVAAPRRVLTNAHVVAGVTDPVVQGADGRSYTARVVFFDARHDVAILAVPRLTAPTLALSPVLGPGQDAVFDGYPLGGPFRSSPAAVRGVGTAKIHDIYNATTVSMPIYSLAADVEHGNSGGPLLAPDGRVAGVIFATDANGAAIGYALTPSVVDPVVEAAPRETTPVGTGRCVPG
ncbi:MAG TPA: MarP family serine protease [Microbacteriaceae bacterium]|nr:MarP family serine protease [Microbacteriaceae bacterium]